MALRSCTSSTPSTPVLPRRAWKRFIKDKILARHLPGLARRLFRVSGVTGFVARKGPVTPSAVATA